jgi:uncharacterized protein YecE (DUF72 family)
MARAYIGCSGWEYPHWRGSFYPPDLPHSRWLEHYQQTFDTVEINRTFYRLPAPATFASWRRRVPAGFVFAVKASRFLTHMKKLKDPHDAVQRLFEAARSLGPALGPVLYQLPPRWRVNPDRLTTFIAALPTDARHAFEFRDVSWYEEQVLAALDRPGLTMCLHDMPGSRTDRCRVGGFRYVRFHGADAKYGGRYTVESLEDWAGWLNRELRAGCDVFAYFNNDVGGHAPRDAVRLRSLLSS